MKIQLKLVALFLCAVFLSGCKSSWREPLPEGEIIYMSGWHELSLTEANGNSKLVFPIDDKFDKPVWSKDTKTLFGLSGGPGSYYGYPAYWEHENGLFKICDHDMPNFAQIQGVDNIENPYDVIIQNAREMYLFDIAGCNFKETILDYSNDPGKYALAGFSYFADTEKLVFGLVVNPYDDREYHLLSLDLKTGEQVEIGEGINPTWSPDGSQIAYLGLDGIYVISENGAEIKQLTNYPVFDVWGAGSPWSLTPKPQWSPDGKWLVYHRCNKPKVCMMGEAQIYKMRVSDGFELELVYGGEYPSWRPLPQE